MFHLRVVVPEVLTSIVMAFVRSECGIMHSQVSLLLKALRRRGPEGQRETETRVLNSSKEFEILSIKSTVAGGKQHYVVCKLMLFCWIFPPLAGLDVRQHTKSA